MIPKRFLLLSGLLAAVHAFAPGAKAQGQAPVSSQNATVQYPTAFTPTYIGGSGSGNWEFLVSGYTTWSLSNGSPTGTKLANGTWVTAWTPPASGSYSFTVAHLGSGSYAVATSGSYTLTVTAPTNGITWNSINSWPSTGTEGTSITFSASVTNSGSTTWGSGYSIVVIDNTTGSQVASTAISAAPGATLSAVTFSFTLPSTLGSRSYNLQAYQSGVQYFGAVQSKTINIVANAPVITSASSYTGTVGSTFYYAITATNSPTSYNATNLPAGVSVNTSTGVISGTPTTAGATSVGISATNSGGTASGTLSVTIHPPAPVVTSASKTATAGSAFSYQISATNSPTSYNATGLPSGLSVNTSTGLISGTPTSVASSSVNLSATNAGGTGTGTLSLTVNPMAPVITSPTSATVTVNTAFSYNITATNSPTSYSASGLPAGLSINTSSGLISGTPTSTGNSTVQLSASNSGGTGTEALTLSVAPPIPVVTSASKTATAGSAFSYQISATNSPTSYNATGLPSGLSVNTSSGLISGTPTSVTNSTVNLSATNAGGTGTGTLTLSVNPAAPVITSPTSATVTVNTSFSYNITATNSPTSYGATGLPAGLSVNTSSGLISGTPSVTGTYTVSLSAANAGGTGTVSLTVTVVPPVPVVTSASKAANVGSSFSYQISATNSPTSYNGTGLPGGLSVNTSTGLISGTPTAVANSTVNLSATNAGGTGTGTLTLSVNPAAPVINSSTSATVTVNTAFSYNITATNSPTSYSASGLPAGLSVNTSSGLISGTPTSTGTSTVQLGASNAGGTGTVTLTLNVVPPVPVINSATSATGTVGFAFNYQITATNSPTSYNATNLPAGLSVNTSTGLISGTPVGAVTNPVTISATNAGGTASETITVTISNPTNGIIWNGSPSGPASGPAGSNITFTASVTNSGTTTWTNAYSIAITDNASGSQVGSAAITGAPGTTLPTVSLTFTLNATVQSGRVYDFQAYQSGVGFFGPIQTVSINIVQGVPVISSAPTAPATVNTFFSYTVQASYMTVEPYSYNATGLPPGITINTANGLISGTPSTTGTYNVSLSATNVTATGTGALTITVSVNPNVPSITSSSTATGTVNQAFSYTVTATPTGSTFAASGLPAGLTLNGATISGTPMTNGTTNATLTASYDGFTSPNFNLAITIQANSSGAPAITSPQTAIATVNSFFLYQITTNSTTQCTYSAAGLPSGLSIDTSTGAITGTVTAAGSPAQVLITATNGGGSGSEYLTITISSTSSNVPAAVLSQLGVSNSAQPDSTNKINLQVLNPQGP